jgi:methenyltetrahydromethanopterin cyclohydrolase
MEDDTATPPRRAPSVGRLALPLMDALCADADALRISVSTGPLGCRLVDAGLRAVGGLEAGRRIAELSLGGLGRVALTPAETGARWPFMVTVSTSDPVLACLGCQYAGWSLSGQPGEPEWTAIASGPGRARAGFEAILLEIGCSDDAPGAVLVLETEAPPPAGVVREVAERTLLDPSVLSFVLVPTTSLAGSVQVAARVLEVALHKAHLAGFPLTRIVDGLGTAPLPPPAPDAVEAMGRTNDAIIHGGRVHLFVTGDDDGARSLAADLPSDTTAGSDRPFAEIYAASGGDFRSVDPALFAPAEVLVTALQSGSTFRGGSTSLNLLDASFS